MTAPDRRSKAARAPRVGRALAAALATWLAAAPPAGAGERTPSPAAGPISLHTQVRPSWARLGERVHYEGRAVFPAGQTRARWVPPPPGGDFTWGPLRARLGPGTGSVTRALADTLVVEADLQAFRPGIVSVPGLQLQGAESASAPLWSLPVVRLTVIPVVSATDTAADLRPVRGPLGAPWWERVRWAVVGAGLGVLGLLLALWVATRRRRPVKEAAPAVARDAWAEALRGLAQLRALDLPGRGRFGDHALALTSILRRFLEATEGTPRPGDTTSGAVERLQSARIGPQDMRLVVELLRGWDRVKFARAPSTPEEARRAERSVESFVRRRAPSPAQRAA